MTRAAQKVGWRAHGHVEVDAVEVTRGDRRGRETSSSFEAWFPRLLPFAYNVGYRFFSGNRLLAEDVAQESLTRAFVAWRRVAEHPNPEAWVTTTALHVALEMSRRNRRAERPDPAGLPAHLPSPEVDVGNAAEAAAALQKLSTRQQQVMVLRYYFDYSVSETATALGLSDSKVKDATHEATTKLARLRGRTGGSDQ
jgi:RNA polymerase sigma factor (sigma-70 family)